MAYYIGSNKTLTANSEWVSDTRMADRADSVGGSVFTDQDGTIYIEQSPDGQNWDISTSYSVTASDGKGFSENLFLPYWRIRFVNGSTGQGAFRIGARTQGAGDS